LNYPDPDKVPAVWQVGDVILDLYEVKEIFTGGGMGLVYRVHHRDWAMDLAVKSPRPEFFQTQQHIENFEREAEMGEPWHTVSCYYVRRLGGIHESSPSLSMAAVWRTGFDHADSTKAGRTERWEG
jgi:hypothetical protein